jgi:pyruvate dehydrogenase E2 component (dihydrolipoamide acetyltransferase)
MTVAVTILMPRLSDSMEVGTLIRWLRGDGEFVDAGDDLVEIESDKATVLCEAEAAGVLTRAIGEGDTVAVGTVIGWLGAADGASRGSASFRPKASPVARRMALTHGIDLMGVDGTGPNGRITREDITPRIGAAEPETASIPTSDRGDAAKRSLSRAQVLIATRMSESRREIPDFEVRVRVDAEPITSLRALLKSEAEAIVPSVNDFIVKAAALALGEQPRANGAYRGDAWALHDDVNIGMAVATDDGLVVPVIRDANHKPISEITRTTRDLSARARQGRITPRELEGATFTVSNLGMFGVDSFTAIIPPGQAAILAVGAALRGPVVRDDAVLPGVVVDLTLACDHRILYGSDAARLAVRIRELLERPHSLLVS